MKNRNIFCRGLALGLAVLLVVIPAGCTRRAQVSLKVLSSYSGGSIEEATLTFDSGDTTTSLHTDQTGMASGFVPVDTVRLTVEATGYETSVLDVKKLSDLPTAIEMKPLYLGMGTVISEGQPVAGAAVAVWNRTTETGTDGTFTVEGLATGTYAGRVSKQGFADATFSLVVGPDAEPVSIVLQEGQLLALASPGTLTAYEITVSYSRTLKGESGAFDGRVVKNGGDFLVLTGDPAQPAAALMVREGTGYALENGRYVVKGETAMLAAGILKDTSEGLLRLPSTFSARQFTAEKQASAQKLGQRCDTWNMRGRTTFEGEAVTVTATVSIGTAGALAGVPVKIVINARSQSFFDFVYDAVVEIVSVDQGAAAARFPLMTLPQS